MNVIHAQTERRSLDTTKEPGHDGRNRIGESGRTVRRHELLERVVPPAIHVSCEGGAVGSCANGAAVPVAAGHRGVQLCATEPKGAR